MMLPETYALPGPVTLAVDNVSTPIAPAVGGAVRLSQEPQLSRRDRPRRLTPSSAPAAATAAAVPLPPLTTVAHDLRGPLQALALTAEMLVDIAGETSAPDYQQIERLGATIQRQVLWLQGLVENLHATTSMQAGHFAIHAHPVDVREIVTGLQSVVAPLLVHKAQPLRLALPARSAALPLVVADGRRIGQALLNLLLNASKYCPRGTPITVSVRACGAYVRVAVADRGPGLPPGDPARLFTPGTRGAPADSSQPEGMGLGLAIVQQIVAAHGGRLGAAPRRGGGARFWFDLPALPAQ